jgi:hypothetical protein
MKADQVKKFQSLQKPSQLNSSHKRPSLLLETSAPLPHKRKRFSSFFLLFKESNLRTFCINTWKQVLVIFQQKNFYCIVEESPGETKKKKTVFFCVSRFRQSNSWESGKIATIKYCKYSPTFFFFTQASDADALSTQKPCCP